MIFTSVSSKLGVLTQLLYLLSKPDSPSSQLVCDEVCPMDKKVAAVAPLRSANSLRLRFVSREPCGLAFGKWVA